MNQEARIGHYRLLGELGPAMIGVFYRGRDERLNRDVTLKLMLPDQARDQENTQRFEREAKCLAGVRHPAVIGIYELGYEERVPYLALEPLNGKTLQQRLQEGLRLESGLSLFVHLLGGLEHVHAAGIVNRNLNPSTIFVEDDGSPKIIDFSVCRLMTSSMGGVGNILGTPEYMSAEQVLGRSVDRRSDLFSVGCMLYEMAAGRRPFEAETLMGLLYKIIHEDPDYGLIPERPGRERLLSILRKVLAREPVDRYPDARALSTDLRRVMAEMSGG